MAEYYGAPNDFRNYLEHYGVKGMKWHKRKAQNGDKENHNESWVDRAINDHHEMTARARRHHAGQAISGAIRSAVNRQIEADNERDRDRTERQARRRQTVHNIGRALTNAAAQQDHNRNQSRSVNGTVAAHLRATGRSYANAIRNGVAQQIHDNQSRNMDTFRQSDKKRRKRR